MHTITIETETGDGKTIVVHYNSDWRGSAIVTIQDDRVVRNQDGLMRCPPPVEFEIPGDVLLKIGKAAMLRKFTADAISFFEDYDGDT